MLLKQNVKSNLATMSSTNGNPKFDKITLYLTRISTNNGLNGSGFLNDQLDVSTNS